MFNAQILCSLMNPTLYWSLYSFTFFAIYIILVAFFWVTGGDSAGLTVTLAGLFGLFRLAKIKLIPALLELPTPAFGAERFTQIGKSTISYKLKPWFETYSHNWLRFTFLLMSMPVMGFICYEVQSYEGIVVAFLVLVAALLFSPHKVLLLHSKSFRIAIFAIYSISIASPITILALLGSDEYYGVALWISATSSLAGLAYLLS